VIDMSGYREFVEKRADSYVLQAPHGFHIMIKFLQAESDFQNLVDHEGRADYQLAWHGMQSAF